MSDTEMTTTTEPTSTDESAEPKSEGAGLRAQLEQALAENRQLKQDRLRDSFEKAGLDPTTGLGKAIAKEYDGEPSVEAIRKYAADEYGWAPPDPAQTVQQTITAEQGRLDAASETAGSIAPAPPTPEALAKAEAEGDFATAGAIKAQMLEQRLKSM